MSRPTESTPSRLQGLGTVAALLVSACASPPAIEPGTPSARPPAHRAMGSGAAPSEPVGAAAAATALPAPPAAATASVTGAAPEPLAAVLAFADRLRGLDGAQLQAEIERLRGREGAPAWLQLSLVYAHKQPPELQRAMELAQLAQQDASAEGRPLQALARLLLARLTEQRRLEEQLERQGRQLAEVQRRLDHSLERLEALKAIERSLDRRGPPPRGSDRLP